MTERVRPDAPRAPALPDIPSGLGRSRSMPSEPTPLHSPPAFEPAPPQEAAAEPVVAAAPPETAFEPLMAAPARASL